MKVRPHYSWRQTRLGPRAGSFAAECGGAAETAACLACVWVTESVRDGGREGTSGPQLVCHSRNLLPAAITSDRPGQDQGLIICHWLNSWKWTCTVAHVLWHVSDSLSTWTRHVTWLVCLLPTSTGLLTCLSRFVTRNKTSSPFPRGQSSDELSIVLITTWLLSCVYACHLVLDCLLTSRSPSMPLVCVLSSAALWNQLCVSAVPG